MTARSLSVRLLSSFMDQPHLPPDPDRRVQKESPDADAAEHPAGWSPHRDDAVPESRFPLSVLPVPIGLFALTVFTTLWAGAYHVNAGAVSGAWDLLVRSPGSLLDGWPFAATLLGILVTHEFGHFGLSLIHRVPASLPLFLPGPPQLIGTFGAVIRMRSPIMNRRALFDIGVAGPIAGFLAAVVALFIGLSYSTVEEVRMSGYGLHLGEPLLLQWLAWIVFGPLPDAYDVALHPVAFAAWFGIFVTALNLIPIGQLDGGHVTYALLGHRQRTLAFTMIPILLALGIWGWTGWLLLAGLAGLVGVGHPPVSDPGTELGRGRVWVGWSAVAIFLVCFSPVPFYVG